MDFEKKQSMYNLHENLPVKWHILPLRLLCSNKQKKKEAKHVKPFA